MSLMHPAQLYPRPFTASKIDSSFKVDEGYSEDTRSQDDMDSPNIKLEIRASDAIMAVPMMAGLPDGIMALSEAERSGRIFHRPLNSIAIFRLI